MSYLIYISKSNNPYLNLAIEDWLLRDPQFHDQSILFFYVNTPAVVIGRAQNPWIECDLSLAEKLGIQLARRQSGGGTVYHDQGNLNFSFIVPQDHYDKAQHIRTMIDILQQCGISAHTNQRHDIRVMHQGIDYKVSGSAFRETRQRAFHHATLLFDADLTHLSPVLNPPDYGIEAKGVKSVRSPVINLTQVDPQISIENFLTIAQQMLDQHPTMITEQDVQHISHIQTACQEYQTWDWIFGKTLPFVQRKIIDGKEVEIPVKHGIVESSNRRFKIVKSI